MAEITQAELAEYHALMKLEKSIKEKREKLRLSLIERLARNRPVQRGKFCVRYIKSQAKVISRIAVVEALGEQAYQSLRDAIPSVERHNIRVMEIKEE